ncbi:MAG: lamin tail domain-containing protein [Bacillota bacterium]
MGKQWYVKRLAVILSLLLAASSIFIPNVAASTNTSILITAVYFDTVTSNEPEEAVRLHNPTSSAVDISGWQFCNDNSACTTFPAGTSLAAGASLWMSKEADDFTREWTFKPNFEATETDSSVPNTSGAWPSLANTGEAVYLKNGSGAIVDMVVYGSGTPAAGDPWTGAAVPVVSAGQLIHRAFDESLLDANGRIVYRTDTNSAADWKQGSEWRTAREFRRNQPFLGLPTWSVTGALTAYTTPDSSFAVVGGQIDAATTSIDMQVYEIQSYQIYEKLSGALARGVKVRLYMEGNVVGGLPDQTKWLAKELTKQGAQVAFITSSTGYQRYNFTHSKFGIIDSARVFVQSENLKANGTPADPSYGNRGWGVLVSSPEAVAYFQNVFDTDWNTASPDLVVCTTGTDFCSPTDGFVPDQTITTASYPHPYNSYTFNESYTITPVMAPDHGLLKTRALRKAFADATKEILAEHMYLRKYWGGSTCNETDCPNLWLQDLIDAARRGVRVRITLGGAYLDPNSPTDNTYTVAMINSIAAAEGLDMEARLENLEVNQLEKIHNKGFIIDGKKVFVSSINGSENSPSENREAALLIENANVAEFYRDVWHWNWHMGKDDAGVAQPIKHIVLSEVMYDTPGTESAEEWLELYNPTSAAVDLSGWALQDNAATWAFPTGTTIGAGQALTVARDSAGFSALYGFAPHLSGMTLSMANSADHVLLVDPRGNAISKVAWGGAKPNWSMTTAQNTTLERCPVTTDRFTVLDWRTGAAATPGLVPAECGGSGESSGGGGGGGSAANHLLVSEVFYDTPGDDTKEEWIELHNPTASAVDISGWTLSDNNGSWSIPSGTSIAAGQFLVVARNATGFHALYGVDPNVSGLTLSLGNSGDLVRLNDPSGVEIDTVAWEGYVSGWSVSAGTGESIHRCPDGTDTDGSADWLVKATETPGSGCGS